MNIINIAKLIMPSKFDEIQTKRLMAKEESISKAMCFMR
jgi:hypothetical protein